MPPTTGTLHDSQGQDLGDLTIPDGATHGEIERATIQALIGHYAPQFKVPIPFALAIGETENHFRSTTSPTGALGPMQLMPATAQKWKVDPTDPEQNIKGGLQELHELLDHFQGNERLAAAAYNAGLGAVMNAGGVPAFRETVDYTKKIDKARRRYEKELGGEAPQAPPVQAAMDQALSQQHTQATMGPALAQASQPIQDLLKQGPPIAPSDVTKADDENSLRQLGTTTLGLLKDYAPELLSAAATRGAGPLLKRVGGGALTQITGRGVASGLGAEVGMRMTQGRPQTTPERLISFFGGVVPEAADQALLRRGKTTQALDAAIEGTMGKAPLGIPAREAAGLARAEQGGVFRRGKSVV